MTTHMLSDVPALSRRRLLTGAGALSLLALAGCASTGTPRTSVAAVPAAPRVPSDVLMMYGPLPEETFPIPAARIARVDPRFWRQEVDDPTGEPAGTVVVDTGQRFCYHVLPDGRAMRYGVGIGREGFSWSGRAHVAYKRAWPRWTPPADMIAREPSLEAYRNGMEPGLDNPLGARALYIHQGNQDTLYRLHGSNEEFTIGQAVSSGCVRFMQHDIIHLHDNVRSGSPILVV